MDAQTPGRALVTGRTSTQVGDVKVVRQQRKPQDGDCRVMTDRMSSAEGPGDGQGSQGVATLRGGFRVQLRVHEGTSANPDQLARRHNPAQAELGVTTGVGIGDGQGAVLGGQTSAQKIVHPSRVGTCRSPPTVPEISGGQWGDASGPCG